jgi:alpha 1,3-glucosidase
VTIETPLDRIPVFVRGGAILPLQERLRRATTQMISDPYTLFVALDSNVLLSRFTMLVSFSMLF